VSFHSGFIAIIGRPNAGKSTLVNALTGHKVAIVTPRPQTTRNRIQGIVNRPDAQAVLIDTPGLHTGRTALNRHMIEEVGQAMQSVDILALMMDVTSPLRPDDRLGLERARGFRGPVYLLLNKIDAVAKEKLLPLIDQFRNEQNFAEIFPISAMKGDGLPQLMDAWIRDLPKNPPFFPTDQFTDQPERFLAAEFIREKAIRLTREEVPHAIAVFVDHFEEQEKLLKIYATLCVERESQKGILVGKRGETIKKIGTEARRDIEKLFGTHIFLDLRVKVLENWRERPEVIRQLDWRLQLEQISAAQNPDTDSDPDPEHDPDSGPERTSDI